MPEPVRRKEAVLLVDDDARILKFVTRMLASFGFSQVYEAETVPQALDLWELHRAEIGLLITDFVMPGATGDVLAQKLLEKKPELPVLFISGNDLYTLNSKIPLHPGRNFLQKPFTLLDLRYIIDNALAPRTNSSPQRNGETGAGNATKTEGETVIPFPQVATPTA